MPLHRCAPAIAARRPSTAQAFRQRGAVLVVGLIMLAVMTLLVISMLRTSILELRIGGANQVAQETFANAELAISNFLNTNTGRFAPGFLTLSASAPGAPDFTLPAITGGAVALAAAQIQCSSATILGNQYANVGRQNALFVTTFNIRGTSNSVLGGNAAVNQGVMTFSAGC
jgi:Tfp pilus assembly protein PilX